VDEVEERSFGADSAQTKPTRRFLVLNGYSAVGEMRPATLGCLVGGPATVGACVPAKACRLLSSPVSSWYGNASTWISSSVIVAQASTSHGLQGVTIAKNGLPKELQVMEIVGCCSGVDWQS